MACATWRHSLAYSSPSCVPCLGGWWVMWTWAPFLFVWRGAAGQSFYHRVTAIRAYIIRSCTDLSFIRFYYCDQCMCNVWLKCYESSRVSHMHVHCTFLVVWFTCRSTFSVHIYMCTCTCTYAISMYARTCVSDAQNHIMHNEHISPPSCITQYVYARPNQAEVVEGIFVPWCQNCSSGAVEQGLGIVGAVIMPHNYYLHSGLVLVSHGKHYSTLAARNMHPMYEKYFL